MSGTRTDTPCPHPSKEKQPNQHQAQKRVDKLTRKHGPQGSLHAYECVCGYWHLGRANKEPKSNRKADR